MTLVRPDTMYSAVTLMSVLVAVMAIPSSTLVADTMSSMLKSLPQRQNDDIIEESLKDAASLIVKHGYPVEEHQVITADGYVLTMHRVPGGNIDDGSREKSGSREPVFLMHGILCSSACWIISGSRKSLAYTLADAGYDVWMGNARGNYYSRKHLTLDPDRSKKFWKFSWDEIGLYDLPVMIDYVLNATGRSSLQYIGHSQGTTSFFVMTSKMPEYNAKIRSMQALAPAAFVSHQRSRIFQLITDEIETLQRLTDVFKVYETIPRHPLTIILGHTVCREGSAFQVLCINVVELLFGNNRAQFNKTLLPVYMSHAPAGGSFNQIYHYSQGVRSGKFRRFDYGPMGNLAEYGTREPPDYDLKSVTAPVYLHISDGDLVSVPRDAQRLHARLGNSMGLFKASKGRFTHLDYMWAEDAKSLLYKKLIKFMRRH